MSNTENHFQKHKLTVERFFDGSHVSIYTDASLQQAIAENRAAWHLSRVAIVAIAGLLVHESRLKAIDLGGSANYPPMRRYVWGVLSPFELALSLRSNAYLSHGTAAYLRGLIKESPTTFHVNKEQSPKQQSGVLTQEGLDRAFSSRPRQSNLVFSDDNGRRYVVIAGKSTDHLGVGAIKGPAGERLFATKVERTLVDMAVRPIYCGGVGKVLEAYGAARDQESPRNG